MGEVLEFLALYGVGLMATGARSFRLEGSS
jgi:hypothetical protein